MSSAWLDFPQWWTVSWKCKMKQIFSSSRCFITTTTTTRKQARTDWPSFTSKNCRYLWLLFWFLSILLWILRADFICALLITVWSASMFYKYTLYEYLLIHLLWINILSFSCEIPMCAWRKWMGLMWDAEIGMCSPSWTC